MRNVLLHGAYGAIPTFCNVEPERSRAAAHPIVMILVPIEMNDWQGSSNCSAAIASSRGDLKTLVLLVREAGWGVIVTKSLAGDHNVIAVADPSRRSALVGDIRRWHREHGYTFALDSFTLDDREIQIDQMYTLASGFTHWGIATNGQLPPGYIRL